MNTNAGRMSWLPYAIPIALLVVVGVVVHFRDKAELSKPMTSAVRDGSSSEPEIVSSSSGFIGQWADRGSLGEIEILLIDPDGTGTYSDHPMTWRETSGGIEVTMNEKFFTDINRFTFRMVAGGQSLFSPEIYGGTEFRRFEFQK